MKPTQIIEILDLAKKIRKKGKIFNPLFTGDAGVGKSEICQQWVEIQRETNPNFGFIDLRIAYMEAPDLIGFPKEVVDEERGGYKTIHCLPDFWPRSGEGLLLLEEPNRGTSGVMNCLMQLLDKNRRIHKYELPPGWLIAGAINPDDAAYDVNAMDFALRDRFTEYEITFDHNAFVDYIEKHDWNEMLRTFIKSGVWIYHQAKDIKEGGQYISPRTFSKLQAAEAAGVQQDKGFHYTVATSILGQDIGKEYWTFCHNDAPVLAADLLKDKANALRRLKKHSNKDTYQGDMIGATVDSVIAHYGGLKETAKKDQIDEELMAEVAKIIPSDQALNLIKACGYKQNKGKPTAFFKEFIARHPELKDVLKSNIVLNRATKVDG
jgi:hypothetical protein